MASYDTQLPINLIDALIQQESKWEANAVNKKSKAVGLGQIMPPALADFNLYNKERYTMQDMFDPQLNQRVTYWYLYDRIPNMLAHYKMPVTIENVLASYNYGIGNVKNHKPLPKETRDYIKNIKNNMELIDQGKLFGGEPLK